VRIGLSNAIDTIAPFAKKRVATKLPLAMMYIRNHDENDALATIESVMTGFDQLQRGDQIAALGAAGIIYSQCTSQSLTDRAYDAYQRCLKLDPNRIDVLNNLACLLADDYSPPRVDEGMTYAQRAMDLVTDSGRPNPTVMDTQGWLLILSGSAAQGVDLINKALDIQPFPDAYLHLGEGYLALQYPDEADKQAQLGLDLIEKQDPKDQDVKVKAKLQNLIVRSEEQMKSKQQAQVP
jgi:tetratricopeptide (TPR) repeat protein